MSHDVKSQTQTLGEEARRMILKYLLIVCLSYGIYMVYLQTIYGHQGRAIYCQHGPCIYYINKIAIYWRLLIKFSCNPYLISILRFITYVVLQLRNLSIGLGEESCIGFTQENLMENSLQDLSLLIYVVTLVHATTMLFLP